MRYLLDTNAISDLVVDPRGKVAGRIADVGEKSVVTSVIVRAEILFGVHKRGSAELSRKVANVLSRMQILSFEPPADEIYAQTRLHLERQGRPIGVNDLWIAAHALTLDCTVVTANEREFSRVPGLKVENWRRREPE